MAAISRDFVTKNGIIIEGDSAVTSSTNQTDALQAAGGAAIAKNLIVGTTATVFGDTTLEQSLTVNGQTNLGGPLIPLTSGLSLGSSSNPFKDLFLTGDSLYVGQVILASSGTTATLYSTSGAVRLVTESIQLTSTTNSTSTNTGSLVVSGGIGLAKDLYVGNKLTVVGISTLTGAANLLSTLSVQGQATFADSTLATIAGAGSVKLTGGVRVGSNAVILSTASNTGTLESNALYVLGGVGINNGLAVSGTAVFKNDVYFQGETTYVYSTNTIYTDNILDLHIPMTGIDGTWIADDGKDIGLRFNYYNSGDKNALLLLSNNSKKLEFFSDSTEVNGNITNAVYGEFKTGAIQVANTTSNNNTTNTGALTVVGGVGIGKDLRVGGTITATNVVFYSTVTNNGLVYQTADGRLASQLNVFYNTATQILIGTISRAENLTGGQAGYIPIQSNNGITTFISAGNSQGEALLWDALSNSPYWGSVSGIAASVATTATHLAAGSTGNIPYQSNVGRTTFLSNGSNGSILTFNTATSAPQWSVPGTLTVGYAGTATYALLAETSTHALLADTATLALLANTATYALLAETSTHALLADTATLALLANTATYALLAETATLALLANTATYALLAETATLALLANTATYALLAETATHALLADTATYAISADFATSSTYAFTSTYAEIGGSAGYALFAGTATRALLADTATYALLAETATHALLADTATYALLAETSTHALLADTATYALLAETSTYALLAETSTHALLADTATLALLANTATYALLAETATHALLADTATYALLAETATLALLANTATYALLAETSTYALLAETSTHALLADTATYALLAETSTYALLATTATYATYGGTSTFALYAGTATYALLAETATHALLADTATYALLAETATHALLADTATYALLAETSTHALLADTATYALLAETSTYALLAETATHALLADTATLALLANTATYALLAETATLALLANTATYALLAETATHALLADTATYALLAETSTYALYAGTATLALLANTATYAVTATFATSSTYAFTATYAEIGGSSAFASTASWASTASNINGGLLGSLPYQSSFGITTFLGIGTSTYLLTSNGASPEWTSLSSLSSGNTAFADNVKGGDAGQLVYQITTSTTGFVDEGVAGNILVSNGVLGPSFTDTSTIRVGYANTSALSLNAITATYATNVLGGATGSLVYQSNTNTTALLAGGSTNSVLTYINNAPIWSTTATFSGGTANSSTVSTQTLQITSGGLGVTGNSYFANDLGIGGAINVANTSYVNGSRILIASDLETVIFTATYITNDPTSETGLAAIANTTTVYGTYNFGTVTDIQTINDYNTGTNTGFYSINDATGTPGYIVYVGFSNVTDFTRLVLNINYTANSGHTVQVDLYNYIAAGWDTLTTFSGSTNWYQFILAVIDSAPYISSGKVVARVYHSSAGSTSHRTWIDYAALENSVQGGQGPRGATGATGATGPQGLTTTTTSTFIFSNATDSTSTTTGAVVVAGGVGIGKSLFVGGDVTILSTASSTSTVQNNALRVEGGVGINGSLFVDGPAFFSDNVVFYGTSTSIFSTSTVYTDNYIDLHFPSDAGGTSGVWSVDDGKDIGHIYHHYKADTGDDHGALLWHNASDELRWYMGGVEYVVGTGSWDLSSATFGVFRTGSIAIQHTTASNSTLTGALVVAGGVGIGGALYVNTASFINGAQILTTATVNQYASQTTIFAGTDTAVDANTGAVTVWNTSTLQTVTGRGATTTNAISITNTTSSTSTTTGALTVTGGVGVRGSLYAGNIYSNGALVLTSAGGSGYVSTINAGTDTAVSTSTGAIVVWNTSTLQTVTSRGSSTNVALSLTNTTASTGTTTGALTVSGGVGVGGSVYVGNRVGFTNASNVSAVYQYYNTATNSLDTVFG